MGKVLTAKQIEQYQDEGFIAPIRVMSEDKALKVKERVEEAEKPFLKNSIRKTATISILLSWYWMSWHTIP